MRCYWSYSGNGGKLDEGQENLLGRVLLVDRKEEGTSGRGEEF